MLVPIAAQKIGQRRKIAMNRAPRESIRLERENAMRGFIRLEHAPVGVGRDYGRGTALDKHFQLFFGLATSIALPFDLMKMLQYYLAVLVDLVNEQSHAE